MSLCLSFRLLSTEQEYHGMQTVRPGDPELVNPRPSPEIESLHLTTLEKTNKEPDGARRCCCSPSSGTHGAMESSYPRSPSPTSAAACPSLQPLCLAATATAAGCYIGDLVASAHTRQPSPAAARLPSGSNSASSSAEWSSWFDPPAELPPRQIRQIK